MTRRPPHFGIALVLIAACDMVAAGPNRPPVPVMVTPAASALYSAGETVMY